MQDISCAINLYQQRVMAVICPTVVGNESDISRT